MLMSDNEVVPRNEYPADVRAEAVAIVWTTGNCAEAYRVMKERHPERYPGRDLIWRWAKSADPTRFNALQQERKETVQNRAVDLALRSADLLEDELEAGHITGQQLAVTYGISSDKVLEQLKLERGSGDTTNYILALINQHAERMRPVTDPDVIEGEAHDPDDDGDDPLLYKN